MLCLHVKKSVLYFIHLKNERVAIHNIYKKIQKYKKYYIFSVRVINIILYVRKYESYNTFDCCVSYIELIKIVSLCTIIKKTAVTWETAGCKNK